MATEQLPEPSNIVLRRFFETSESARKAASHLKAPAEVGVRFTDVAGEYRLTVVDGKPRFLDGKAKDPDFELTLAPGAVTAIAAQPNADVGELGILFFQHIVAQDPAAQDRGEAAQRADQADHARLGRRDDVGRRQGPRLAGVERSQGPI